MTMSLAEADASPITTNSNVTGAAPISAKSKVAGTPSNKQQPVTADDALGQLAALAKQVNSLTVDLEKCERHDSTVSCTSDALKAASQQVRQALAGLSVKTICPPPPPGESLPPGKTAPTTCPAEVGIATVGTPSLVAQAELAQTADRPVPKITKPIPTLADGELATTRDLAVQYLSASGSPINLANYNWLACNETGNSADSPSKTSKSSSKESPASAFFGAILKNVTVASDEYSLAYQSACNNAAPVPNDPIYANSGLSISLSENGYNTSGVGPNAKTTGTGSGKFVGAVGFDVIRLVDDTLNGSSNTVASKTPLFLQYAHLFPYVGIDYEYNQKSAVPGVEHLVSSYSVKHVYYGAAFNITFPIKDPSKCQSNEYLVPSNVAQPGQVPYYSPVQTDSDGRVLKLDPAGKDVTSETLANYRPVAADSDALSSCGLAQDPSLSNYYVWEKPKGGLNDFVNLTADAFVLNDQIAGSQIGVVNSRFVFFGLFPIFPGRMLGVNEYNRPPIYIANYPTNRLLGAWDSADPPCDAGQFCGFDWDLWSDTRFALIADARLDVGHFIVRGTPQSDPALNEDYVRLGGRFGGVMELNVLRNNPIALQATYLLYDGLVGFGGNLGLMQIEMDYDLPNLKDVTLALSYENGRNQDTAQRVDDWMFSVKFTPH